MKKILTISLVALFAACSPSRIIPCPGPSKPVKIDAHGYAYSAAYHEIASDTLCEWMHVSRYQKGLVIAQMALSVRENGHCIAHLDCDKKPFPVDYTVGWCQGKEQLFNQLVSERRAKQ
jgi:hypothetical protein